ncbi:kinase/pyrophosphorylase [Peptoniphilus equinus]|uniref:Putative pyruvate, phosphate dikinase regulatory protein n=1 Tax=Peptoniphilus equinus TaxID=3016343 RepID=A0ABY7QWB5_9FIRM|nr:pyruvate, water dikinase regulatory protein [Peptoniphilus equinus]WBW50384.1 kinase/pyrophosphorylase [Peptoniphilus equinus]
MDTLYVYVISDSIGETGELIAKASVKQFDTDDFEIKRYPYHNSIDQIEPILDEAAKVKSLIVYTNVVEETRAFIEQRAKALNLHVVDVMGAPMKAIEAILGYAPLREPGLIRRLDENYFKKVEAVEFAVKYDDGKDPRGAKKADICLVGISRTSKTPLSMYLANKNFKVANIPLVPEVPVPKEVYDKDVRRVIGLTCDPAKLISIRTERLKSLGLSSGAKYANLERVQEELDYSKKVMTELGCKVFDVTNSAVEETAELIVEYMRDTFEERD